MNPLGPDAIGVPIAIVACNEGGGSSFISV